MLSARVAYGGCSWGSARRRATVGSRPSLAVSQRMWRSRGGYPANLAGRPQPLHLSPDPGLPRAARSPPRGTRRLLVFPDAVALAELFWDLEWRRHVAIGRRSSASTRTPSSEAVAGTSRPTTRVRLPPALRAGRSPEPLRGWIRQHRARYAAIRNQFNDDLRRSPYMFSRPFPEIRHFA